MRIRTAIASAMTAAIAVASVGGPALAAPSTGRITVVGVGKVVVERDRASLGLGVSVIRASAREAQAALTSVTTDLRTALVANDVAAKDLTTTGLSLFPEHSYDGQSAPRIVGYRASLSLAARTSPASVGALIDAAVSAAGDAVTVQGVEFSASTIDAALAKARIRAMRDARVKARDLAKAAGVSLGRVTVIVDSSPISYPNPYFARDRLVVSGVPIDPGTFEVTSTVTVTFRTS